MARCVNPVTVINRFTSVTVRQMPCLLHEPPPDDVSSLHRRERSQRRPLPHYCSLPIVVCGYSVRRYWDRYGLYLGMLGGHRGLPQTQVRRAGLWVCPGGVDRGCSTHRAFKRSTFRLNGVICIGIFLGFFGDFAHSLSVHYLLENITVMDVIINVSPVKCSYVTGSRVALHCVWHSCGFSLVFTQFLSSSSPSPPPPPPGVGLVV